MKELEELNICASRNDDYEISNADLKNLEMTLQSLLVEPNLPVGIFAQRAFPALDDLVIETA